MSEFEEVIPLWFVSGISSGLNNTGLLCTGPVYVTSGLIYPEGTLISCEETIVHGMPDSWVDQSFCNIWGNEFGKYFHDSQ